MASGSDLFRLDRRGVGQILQSQTASAVNAVAREIADNARGQVDNPDDVFVSYYSTDRKAAAVTVPAELQAIGGVLTRAASAAGLEVSS